MLLLATLVIAFLHSGHPLDSDEGVVLSGAWHLRHGMRPYTDFFEFIGPASFYVVHWAWLALGPEYWVAKLLGASAIGVAALGLYRLTLAALPADAARFPASYLMLPVVLWCLLSGYWQTINHNTFSLPFAVWAVVYAARMLADGRRRDAAASGALVGLTALFLQHRAAAVAAGIAVVLLCRPGRRYCLPVFTAAVMVGAAPLLYWPPQTIIGHLVLFPLQHYSAVNQILPVAPAIAALGWLAAGWTIRGHINTTAWLLFFVQPFLLASTQRADLSHVSQNVFPMLALLPAVIASKTARRGDWFVRRVSIYIILILPAAIAIAPLLVRRSLDENTRQYLVREVRATCAGSEYMYAGPFLPGWYFEVNKLNPTPYSVMLTGFNTAAQYDAAAKALARAAPPCALTDYAMVAKFGHGLDNPVDRYLADQYTAVHTWGNLKLWRRRTP
jgi:hypothetical protein